MTRPLRRAVTAVAIAAALSAVVVEPVLTAAHATPATTAATRTTAVSTAGFPSGSGKPGIFTEKCKPSHVAADDPILDPGKPGHSMRHVFFGNTATNASSTASSLRGGKTTCRSSADASAYWIPVMTSHGHPVSPIVVNSYWRLPRHDQHAVHDMPSGLQMIAGNENATSPQPHHISWTCTGPASGATRTTDTPHSCTNNGHLKLTIAFPSCWNGHTLSATNQTNVVYKPSVKAACPSSHPVQIPQILFHVIYSGHGMSGSGLQLSMSPTMYGSTDTAHADFINGWNQTVLDRDTQACIATHTSCGGVSGPQATPHGPKSVRNSH